MRPVAFVMVLLALAGCAEQEPPSKDSARCDRPAQVVDTALLAYLSKARSVHLQADLAEAEGHIDEAIALLDKLVHAPAPGASDLPPEIREVLADTLARLAELRSARHEHEAARADIQRGLELAQARTHFRGRLYEVLGAVEKRVFEELRDKGDGPGAKAAKQRSLKALEEAVAIQEEVIQRALGDTP